MRGCLRRAVFVHGDDVDGSARNWYNNRMLNGKQER